MAAYKPPPPLDELMRSPPQGSTHLDLSDLGYDYILHGHNYYRVWLGRENGWSQKQPNRHHKFEELIPLIDTKVKALPYRGSSC